MKYLYTLPEFDEWKKSTKDANQYNIKYYKGLDIKMGDIKITAQEAKSYVLNIKRHCISLKWNSSEVDEAIKLVFSKKMVGREKRMAERENRRKKKSHNRLTRTIISQKQHVFLSKTS